MTRQRRFRYRTIAPGEYAVHLRDSNEYLGVIRQDGTRAFPWVGEVTLPVHPNSRVAIQRRVIGATRDDTAGILWRYWRDYPQYRPADPRDGRRDDVPVPEAPDERWGS